MIEGIVENIFLAMVDWVDELWYNPEYYHLFLFSGLCFRVSRRVRRDVL